MVVVLIVTRRTTTTRNLLLTLAKFAYHRVLLSLRVLWLWFDNLSHNQKRIWYDYLMSNSRDKIASKGGKSKEQESTQCCYCLYSGVKTQTTASDDENANQYIVRGEKKDWRWGRKIQKYHYDTESNRVGSKKSLRRPSMWELNGWRKDESFDFPVPFLTLLLPYPTLSTAVGYGTNQSKDYLVSSPTQWWNRWSTILLGGSEGFTDRKWTCKCTLHLSFLSTVNL